MVWLLRTFIFFSSSIFKETCLRTVLTDNGHFRPPPLTRVDPHATKRGMSMCPDFFTSISRCRLLSQDKKLCFSRLRAKEAGNRRQIRTNKISDVQISFRCLTEVNGTSKFWLELTDVKCHCRKIGHLSTT